MDPAADGANMRHGSNVLLPTPNVSDRKYPPMFEIVSPFCSKRRTNVVTGESPWVKTA